MTNYEQVNDSTQFSRRTFENVILAVLRCTGASGVGSMRSSKSMSGSYNQKIRKKMRMNFMVKCNQALLTPTQKHALVALDLKSKDRDAITISLKSGRLWLIV